MTEEQFVVDEIAILNTEIKREEAVLTTKKTAHKGIVQVLVEGTAGTRRMVQYRDL